MHENVPVRFGRGRLDSLGNKGLAAYLMRWALRLACVGREDRSRQRINANSPRPPSLAQSNHALQPSDKRLSFFEEFYCSGAV